MALDIICINKDRTSQVCRLEEDGVSSHTDLYVKSGTDIDRVVLFGEDQSIEVEVVEGVVPEHPFYVRWINERGGWETHMFDLEKRSLTTKDIHYRELDIVDSELATEAKVPVFLKAWDEVSVFEDALDELEYNKLSRIAVSPKIEWWNEQLQQWMRVLCPECTNSWESGEPSGDVSLTFRKSKTLVQF